MTARAQRIAGAFAFLLCPAFASMRPAAGEETPTAVPAATNGVATQSYGLNDPKCLEWTDGCVVCTKDGCSNIGIACQPKAISCRDPLSKPDK